MKALLLLNFIVPFVMLLVGGLLQKHPQPYPGNAGSPKWKASGSGYNSPRSRKSKAHWDYAQQAGPENFVKRGKQALVAAVVCVVIGLLLHWIIGLVVGYILGFVFMTMAFVDTEQALKERFGP